MYANATQIYNENNASIESPYKLIEMMYEGILRFNAQAKKAIKEEKLEKKVYWINRSIVVIVELIASLQETEGSIAIYLDGLYNYQIQLLSQAVRDDDIAKIEEVTTVFKGLLEAWRESRDVA